MVDGYIALVLDAARRLTDQVHLRGIA